MNNQDAEKIRLQLLNMMTASKNILDARRNPSNQIAMDEAVINLQHEYVQSIVLMKALGASSTIPALLRPMHNTSMLERQMFNFNESLAVTLDEE